MDRFRRALQTVRSAAETSSSLSERQFLFEHCELAMLADYRPMQAGALIAEALQTSDRAEIRRLCLAAMKPLEDLEGEIKRAERPPFDGWYRPTWIRSPDFFSSMSDMNLHRPYEMMRRFMEGFDGR